MTVLAVATLGAIVWISSITFNRFRQNYDQTSDYVQLDPPLLIHLALYDDTRISSDLTGNGMTVSWVTKQSLMSPSVVQFGLELSRLSEKIVSSQKCERYSFCDYRSPCFHQVTIPARCLSPGTMYYCMLTYPPISWYS